MVAGATGIDLFLLVIDAAEGARPQTHEHLAILRLLGVERGVVAVTKADTVDDETLELARRGGARARPRRRGRRGEREDGRRPRRAAGRARPRGADGASGTEPRSRAPTRLYVDRVFTLPRDRHGRHGDAVERDDRRRRRAPGRAARARGARPQRRRCTTARSSARRRGSASRSPRRASSGRAIRRGDALVAAGAFPSSYRLDVALDELEPIAGRRPRRRPPRHDARSRPASCASASGYAQLRLDRPLVTARGDRFVLRGGDDARRRHSSLDPGAAARARRGSRSSGSSARRARGDDPRAGARAASLRHLRGPSRRGCVSAPATGLFSQAWLDGARASELAGRIAAADPLDPGDRRRRPRRGRAAVVPLLGLERRGAKLYLPGRPRRSARAPPRRPRARGDARARPATSPCASRTRALAALPRASGAARPRRRRARDRPGRVRAGARACSSPSASAAGRITLARFRDLLGTGRRPAQLLLERFDADGLTRRIGDERVLRRAARA